MSEATKESLVVQAADRFSIGRTPFVAVLLLLGLFFIGSRIAFIEADPPNWAMGGYEPKDEFYYSITGFNLYHYGTFQHSPVEGVRGDFGVTLFLPNVMLGGSLKVFGNTYVGLRAPSVLSAGIILVLTLVLLRRGTVQGVIPRWNILFLGIALFLVTDFAFFNASRLFEPTIFRMLFVLVAISIVNLSWVRERIPTPLGSLFFGFAASFLVFFVYLTNFFLAVAAFFYLVVLIGRRNIPSLILKSALFGLGAVLAFSLWIVFTLAVSDFTITEIFKKWGLISTTRVAGFGQGNLLVEGVRNWVLLAKANVFTTNPILLPLCTFIIPGYLFYCFKHRPRSLVFFNLVVVMFILQTFFINDFPNRKLVMLVPFVAVLLYFGFFGTMELIATGWFKRRLSYLVPLFVCLFVLLTGLTVVLVLSPKETLVSGLVLLGIEMAALLVYGYSRGRLSLALLLVCLCLPGVWCSYRYTFSMPSFTFRDSMRSLGEFVNGKVVAGGVPHAFRLDNSMQPMVNPYDYSNFPNGDIRKAEVIQKVWDQSQYGLALVYSEVLTEFKTQYPNYEFRTLLRVEPSYERGGERHPLELISATKK